MKIFSLDVYWHAKSIKMTQLECISYYYNKLNSASTSIKRYLHDTSTHRMLPSTNPTIPRPTTPKKIPSELLKKYPFLQKLEELKWGAYILSKEIEYKLEESNKDLKICQADSETGNLMKRELNRYPASTRKKGTTEWADEDDVDNDVQLSQIRFFFL